jgi:hypothetical protein
MTSKDEVTHVEGNHDTLDHKPHHDTHIKTIEEEATEDATHVNLSWRSWVVVFVCCFA